MKTEDLAFIKELLTFGVIPLPERDADTAKAIDLISAEILTKNRALFLRRAKYSCRTCDSLDVNYCKKPSRCASAVPTTGETKL